MQRYVLAVLVSGLLVTSCAKKEAAPSADKPHATIVMRDGTTVTGAVEASSPTEVRIAGDDHVTRTIPTSQVKSIDYGESAAPAQTPAAQPDAVAGNRPSPAPRSAAPPPPAAQAEEDRVHETRHEHAREAAITSKTYNLPAGTEVSVRSEETIDSGKAAEGQTYAAEITRDVRDDAGAVVIPRGANAQIIIRSASKGGRIRGQSDLVLDLKSVSIEGREYELDTADLAQKGKTGVGTNRRTAEYGGGGAALGAIIGAIAGGGKGAGIGAGAGAGAGVLTQILTKGGSIRVPAESVLTFKLDKPLHVVAAR